MSTNFVLPTPNIPLPMEQSPTFEIINIFIKKTLLNKSSIILKAKIAYIVYNLFHLLESL